MNPADILYHLTVACKPDELVETTRGQVTYQQWCEEEQIRIEKKSGWPLAIYHNESTGEISLIHRKIKLRR